MPTTRQNILTLPHSVMVSCCYPKPASGQNIASSSLILSASNFSPKRFWLPRFVVIKCTQPRRAHFLEKCASNVQLLRNHPEVLLKSKLDPIGLRWGRLCVSNELPGDDDDHTLRTTVLTDSCHSERTWRGGGGGCGEGSSLGQDLGPEGPWTPLIP